MKTYSVPERIIELIRAEGVDTIFGIPDPSFFAMYLAAEKQGMKLVAPHHEQGGALMADGLYRMTGRPGVLGINKGPGVANVAAGAAYLAKENVPAVFIMAQRHRVYEERVRRGKMQYMSQRPIFAGVMKYCGTIEYPDQVDEVMHEAFRRAQTSVPGPTFVEMPLSIMQAQLSLPPAPAPHRYRLIDQSAGTREVAEAARLLGAARSPAILLGQGAMVSRAHDAVRELVQKLGCPVLLTNAVDAVIEGLDDCTFAYASAIGGEVAAASDVVLAIGTELGEPVHYGRGHHWAHADGHRKWIYIERDPTAIGVNRPIDVPLVGDLRAIVPQLTEKVSAREKLRDLARWAEARDRERTGRFAAASTAAQPVHTARLAIEATKVLPRDAVIVRDGGASTMWFGGFVQFNPRDAMWNSNYGAIGPGLPYALGAQIAVGNQRRVVLLTGDSSFMFHIAELETAVRKQLPVVCIVAVDNAWGIEVASYRANYGPDTSAPEARWGHGVRFDKTAESFGAHGEFVERAEDIGPAVERALASGRAAVVHVAIDREANSSFAGIPGFAEFRTWYGEEGDNLGFAGTPPAEEPKEAAARPMDEGAGY